MHLFDFKKFQLIIIKHFKYSMQPAIILMLLVPLLGRTQAPKISLIKSILLPGVKGKFAHMAIDNPS